MHEPVVPGHHVQGRIQRFGSNPSFCSGEATSDKIVCKVLQLFDEFHDISLWEKKQTWTTFY